MNARLIFVVIVAVSVSVLIGCGGNGENVSQPPGQSAVTGTIAVEGGSAEGYQLLLNGAPVPATVQPDGSFTITGVPEGTHVLDVIGPDGMSGGRAEFSTVPGQTVPLPPIETRLGGQIVGMITKLEEGVLTPLVGVEVVARSDMPWILDGPTSETDDRPLIYPPPRSQTYSIHTGEDGSYAMRAVTPGPYLVTVAVPGLTTGTAFVHASAGRTAVADFTLEPVIDPGVGTIEGAVWAVDRDGATTPLEGALVEVSMDDGWRTPPPGPIVPLPPDFPVDEPGSAPGGEGEGGAEPGVGIVPPDIYWNVFSTLTDSRGRYSINVPSGRGHVRAWKPGYEGDGRRVTVQPGETLTQEFRLRRVPDVVVPPLPWPEPGPDATAPAG